MDILAHTDFPDWSRSWAERKLAQHHDRGLAMPDETTLRNVRDWLFSLPGTKMHDKLDRISWPQAVEAQAKWHKALARRAERTKAFGGRPDDVDTVMTLDDGYRWVRITSPEGLDYEGNAMGHCVGGGAYDEAVIYSLRDPDNLPHCTVEYKRATNTVSQVQGKANKPVIDRYHGMVGAFIDHLKPEKVVNPGKFGRVFAAIAGQHRRLWPVAEFLTWFQQQDKVEIEGALDLRGCTGLTHLPDGLDVERLILVGCTGLTHLPDSLNVSDVLDLTECTGLTHLPDSLKVDRLDLTGCTGLTHLPDGLKAGWLDLTGCTGLTHLPDRLELVELDLTGCTALTHLPDGLKAGWLDLTGCTGLTHLPDGLEVDRLYLPDRTWSDLCGAQAWFDEKFPNSHFCKETASENSY